MRRSSFFPHWVPLAGVAAAACAWLLLLVASPYIVSQRAAPDPLLYVAGVVYLAGRVVCHQLADRSFHAWGVQLPVCGRCLGLYAAAAAGSLWAVLRTLRASDRSEARQRSLADQNRQWAFRLAVAAVPTLLSVGLEVAGAWRQTPQTRAASALPLGFAAAWLVTTHAPQVFARFTGRSN